MIKPLRHSQLNHRISHIHQLLPPNLHKSIMKMFAPFIHKAELTEIIILTHSTMVSFLSYGFDMADITAIVMKDVVFFLLFWIIGILMVAGYEIFLVLEGKHAFLGLLSAI